MVWLQCLCLSVPSEWSERLLVTESTFQHVELPVCHVILLSVFCYPPKMENVD